MQVLSVQVYNWPSDPKSGECVLDDYTCWCDMLGGCLGLISGASQLLAPGW